MDKVSRAFALLVISCIAGFLAGEYAISQQYSQSQVLIWTIGATFITGFAAIRFLFVGKK